MSIEQTGKVTAEHLRRDAYLYVRQSSLKQVVNNSESTQRQYALRGRAVALGWTDSQIIVIDSDQGRSGSSTAGRDGFQHLVAEVSMGHAGIVLGLEVSRLARNNTDWHRLLEICALSGTLILDEDGLYDPRTFNDRLVLGMKGTMSEAELHLLAARLRGGQLAKARRGELKQGLPVGYVHDYADRIVKDPDTSVRAVVEHVVDLFAATGSARQVVKAFAADRLTFPSRIRTGPRKGELVWGPLKHWQVLNVLHNPLYAGAFCYGRRKVERSPDGRTHIRLLPREQWDTLIQDHHEGYVTFARWETNQTALAAQAASRGIERTATAPREGPALLQGLVICGRCGRRMTIAYHLRHGREVSDYRCMTHAIQNGGTVCQRIPGPGIEQAVATLLLDELTPLAVEAALKVTDRLAAQAAEADRLRSTHLQRAQHRADLAKRRYLAVDPDNRLVADSLEADWNAALREVAAARRDIERARTEAEPVNEALREKLAHLAGDVHRLWHDPGTPMRERKRIARLLITDVTLTKAERITAQVRLSGGRHHTLDLPLPLGGGKLWQTPKSVVAAIDTLLEDHTDAEIADILNQRGLTSGKGLPFHRLLVRDIRQDYQLTSRFDRLRDRGLLTAHELASLLGVSVPTVWKWHRAGLLEGEKYNDKNACLYPHPGPNPPRVQQGVRLDHRRPATTTSK
ncbi:recombinase family protein [Streptomyces phaeochromogenes]|uniref:recombinase family protein n=1 Tax=Streptomyces phaeochromogenes TaxID=1923 RepID=UPI00386DAEF4|nr:recombinase family protein [Streptomyces phaeochromogenes]